MQRNHIIFTIFLILLALVIPTNVPASQLPSLPSASNIRKGLLDNGVTYFLVTNSIEKGKADMALVQKGGWGDENLVTMGSTSVNAMGSLSSLPHFKTQTPYKFLAGNCIWPGQDGYITTSKDATIYRFNNLDISARKELVDSVLLMLFDIIGEQTLALGGRYVPQNQAIVISGDIDANAVVNKMNMLAMLVSKGNGDKVERNYAWEVSDKAKIRHIQSAGALVKVTAEYSSPRTSEQNMSTVLPLVSRKFAEELGFILKRRLRNALMKAGVPVASLDFNYSGSEVVPEDEKYRITLETSTEYIEEAVRIMSSALATLDIGKVSTEEYNDAQNVLMMGMRRSRTGPGMDNSGYLDMCISSFLYGASLASPQSRTDFFITKDLSGDVGAGLFNDFVHALLDRKSNLILEVNADSTRISGERLLSAFEDSWKETKGGQYLVSRSDTLKISRKIKSKLKIKSAVNEPLSGGQMWTFSNDIKVIWKKVPGTGTVSYMWLIKGGYSLVPGLLPGESAYVSDLLKLYDVAGMDFHSFADMLSTNGITMDCEVTKSDFRISGAAPSSRIRLLLKSLQSLSVNRTANRKAYDYYRKCEYVRMMEERSPESVLDSLIFPENAHPSVKRSIKLQDDLQKRAEKYFNSQFSKMNDGVLILIGDLDEYELKKILSRELTAFETEKVSGLRSKAKPNPHTGRNTLIRDGGEPLIEVGYSSPAIFSAENYMAASIAGYVLNDRLSATLSSCGWHGSSKTDFAVFPEERFDFRFRARPSVRSGVPASMVQLDSVEMVLDAVRKTVDRLADEGVGTDLAKYKVRLSNDFESWLLYPESSMQMLVLRYSFGKDLMTGYKNKIGAVSAQSVDAILKSLASGRVAEYVRKGPERRIREAYQQKPYLQKLPSPLRPADDSLSFALDAFRMLGLDSTARTPYWTDSTNFRKFISSLPAPREPEPFDIKADADSLNALKSSLMPAVPASDTLKVKVDSSAATIVVPADSLSVPIDSLYAPVDSLAALEDFG